MVTEVWERKTKFKWKQTWSFAGREGRHICRIFIINTAMRLNKALTPCHLSNSSQILFSIWARGQHFLRDCLQRGQKLPEILTEFKYNMKGKSKINNDSQKWNFLHPARHYFLTTNNKSEVTHTYTLHSIYVFFSLWILTSC